MPTLTHGIGPETGRDAARVGPTGASRGGRTGSVRRSPWAGDAGSGEYGPRVGEYDAHVGEYGAATGSARTVATGSRPRRRVVGAGPTGRQSGRGDESGPATGPPAVDDGFPDLDLKRPAPRVDATRQETDEQVREPRPAEPDRSSDLPDDAERAIREAFFEPGAELSAHSSEVDRVVDKLYREVERRMQIERERRGL